MDSNNPYQAPPSDVGVAANTKPDLGYWVYSYIALKFVGVLVVGTITWYAHSLKGPYGPDGVGWQIWGMLAWVLLGALAAVGVAFRIRLAKHLLVVHLLCTAGLELYAFISMMQLRAAHEVQEVAFDYGWTYFVMALWDLGWAGMFQFSAGLRAVFK